jgi:hypothetical protein
MAAAVQNMALTVDAKLAAIGIDNLCSVEMLCTCPLYATGKHRLDERQFHGQRASGDHMIISTYAGKAQRRMTSATLRIGTRSIQRAR